MHIKLIITLSLRIFFIVPCGVRVRPYLVLSDTPKIHPLVFNAFFIFVFPCRQHARAFWSEKQKHTQAALIFNVILTRRSHSTRKRSTYPHKHAPRASFFGSFLAQSSVYVLSESPQTYAPYRQRRSKSSSVSTLRFNRNSWWSFAK